MEINECYYVYIATNEARSIITTGITGALTVRQRQLKYPQNDIESVLECHPECVHYLYWEQFSEVKLALKRQKEMRRWSFQKMKSWIDSKNAAWRFLNEDL